MTQARSRKHKTVRVNFRAVCSETKWGDTLVVVGSSIGGWSPSSGLRMVTDGSLYPEWNCAAAIELSVRDGSRGTPGGYATEYKLVILRADGSEEWEPLDGNRRIDVGGSAESVASLASAPLPSASAAISAWNDGRRSRILRISRIEKKFR